MSRFTLALLVGMAFSSALFAGEIKLDPGARVTITLGEEAVVSCAGSSTQDKCTCQTEKFISWGNPFIRASVVLFNESLKSFESPDSESGRQSVISQCKDWIRSNPSLCN